MNRYQGIYATAKYLRAHFSKQYTQQWYTEKRAHKLDDRIPATCRCCNNGEDETILHILRCSSRNEVHNEHNRIFEQRMREIKVPNRLLHLFEAVLNWYCLTEICIAARTGTENPMNQRQKEQFRNY